MNKRTAKAELAICERLALMWLHNSATTHGVDVPIEITARQLTTFLFEQRDATRHFADQAERERDEWRDRFEALRVATAPTGDK